MLRICSFPSSKYLNHGKCKNDLILQVDHNCAFLGLCEHNLRIFFLLLELFLYHCSIFKQIPSQKRDLLHRPPSYRGRNRYQDEDQRTPRSSRITAFHSISTTNLWLRQRSACCGRLDYHNYHISNPILYLHHHIQGH